MKQSRTMSLVESLTNVAIGYGIAVVTQIVVFPLFGLSTTIAENMVMGAIFHRGVDRAQLQPAASVRGVSPTNIRGRTGERIRQARRKLPRELAMTGTALCLLEVSYLADQF